jgi:hypothetical protein
MADIIEFGMQTYVYCTDFIINIANITGLSYYEINLVVFIVLYPAFLAASIGIYFIQKIRLNKLVRLNKNHTLFDS